MQSILCPKQTTNIVADYTVSRLMAAGNPTGVFTLANGLLNQSFYSNHGCHSIRTNQRPIAITPPPFLCRMPFLPQPSHFILACDRHQICWLAYPVVWFIYKSIRYIFFRFMIHKFYVRESFLKKLVDRNNIGG